MRQVSELMIRSVATILERQTVAEAREEMELSHIRHLPVVDAEGRLVGVVSDRDLMRAGDPTDSVGACMSAAVATVSPETDLTEAAFLLIRDRIGCLPVSDASGKLLGILTESDFVRLAHDLLGGADLEERLREDEQSKEA